MSESQTAKMPTEATPLRRQPVQQRSAKRVEQMLDASAALIDELREVLRRDRIPVEIPREFLQSLV